MSICLSHTTAQSYWLHAATLEPEADPRAFALCAGDVRACHDELERAIPSSILAADDPLHVLVPRTNARTSTSAVVFHVHTPPLAPNALKRLGPNVFIVSPELSLAQMALERSVARTAQYGSFLCSSYRLPFDPDSTELPARNPLVHRSELAAFLSGNQAQHGCKIAQRALPWIVEGAASPPEVQLALRLCLPFRYGGYNMPLPQMNAVIDLTADEQGVVGKEFLKGDAVWPDAQLVVEYDGFYHASKTQMQADAVRRATLRHAGWTVIEVTQRQLISIDAFEQVAQLVAKQLGRRLRRCYLGATPARLKLIDELFFL